NRTLFHNIIQLVIQLDCNILKKRLQQNQSENVKFSDRPVKTTKFAKDVVALAQMPFINAPVLFFEQGNY
ncbi:MAG: hypothetical protein H6Q65_2854, partial [Firmicutes bacterium]|nr:hypothetical protein [Bacillota bacterium]